MMTVEEVREALAKISASLDDLSTDDLEEVAGLTVELRDSAWAVHRAKLAALVDTSQSSL